MKKVVEKIKALCTAVFSARNDEYNDPANMTDGSFKLNGENRKQTHTPKKKKYVDNRPKLQL